MSLDISHILDGWDFDRHELTVRIVQGRDGASKIQLRTDLGLMQLNLDGRPDGKRPMGCESFLEYFQQQSDGYGEGYQLTAEHLDELFHEGWQYYQRYLCGFQLGLYEMVVRDTSRNLRLSEFVAKHAKRRRDRWRFDQYRPYLLMMRTRAAASLALQDDDPAKALRMIERGCQRISEFLQQHASGGELPSCFELDFLSRWRDELGQHVDSVQQRPPDGGEALPAGDVTDEEKLALLRQTLRQAVEHEQYERAAQLRDEIRLLEQPAQG